MMYKIKLLIIATFLGCLLFTGCKSSGQTTEEAEPKLEEKEEEKVKEEEPVVVAKPTPTGPEYKTLPVPANPGEGMVWEFQEMSDGFDYDAPAENKGEEFYSKWKDTYHNNWLGPGLTEWATNRSEVKDGMLHITAKRKPGSKKINLGIITHKERIQYPVYIETKLKIMNSVLANAAWLLSPDDTQEIDFMEAYGGLFSESAEASNEWYAKRMHVSHHVFIRQPFTDYQPKDAGSWYTDGETKWKDDFHTYGVYWRDPWYLEYYIDGKLVRTVQGKDMIDPVFHTNSVNPGDTSNDTRTGLSKEMDIILDAEDHDWRSNPASGLKKDTFTPTDNELNDTESHTLKVDWIRIFKPKESQ